MGKRVLVMEPASLEVVVIRSGSWLGGEDREFGDSNRSVVGSEGIEGRPNVGRMASHQLGELDGFSELTFTDRYTWNGIRCCIKQFLFGSNDRIRRELL